MHLLAYLLAQLLGVYKTGNISDRNGWR